jgi:GrpB-like predicted nucleotidyltransferase (UPF0157 family)
MIEIKPYQPAWPEEFLALGRRLRAHLGDLALRIDHIGSTAVPQLAAKDIIDMQITVAALTPAVRAACLAAGLVQSRHTTDHLPPGADPDPEQWVKMLFKTAPPERLAHVHVRVDGRANQQYPLLFRDYLRAHPPAAQAYAQVKQALARHHPHDDTLEIYYDIKDPVCDIIKTGAHGWAIHTGWQLGPSDC